MTLSEAAQTGIRRVRLDRWANADAYLRITIFNGYPAINAHLFERNTQEAIGEPTPQLISILGDEGTDYVEYQGPLDRSENNP